MAQNYTYQQQPSLVHVPHSVPTAPTTTTTQVTMNNIGGDDNSSTLVANTEMEIALEAMWTKIMLEIERIDPNSEYIYDNSSNSQVWKSKVIL